MQREMTLKHEFVEYIPSDLKEGTIYISISFATAVHKCCCGCGNEVITPLSRTDWELTFDGESISLDPSVGNWSFPCQSHYWIKRNRIEWAPRWSRKQIEASRLHDRLVKQRYFDKVETPPIDDDTTASAARPQEEKQTESIWHKMKSRWF
jgi:hypothetical protein